MNPWLLAGDHYVGRHRPESVERARKWTDSSVEAWPVGHTGRQGVPGALQDTVRSTRSDPRRPWA